MNWAMRESPISARVRPSRRTPPHAQTRRAAIGLAVAGALALLSVVALPVPRTARADHNSMYVICPDPIEEGNSARMGIRRSGYKVEAATAFTDHRYYTAESDDYTEYHGDRFEQSEGRTLWIPIETKQSMSSSDWTRR